MTLKFFLMSLKKDTIINIGNEISSPEIALNDPVATIRKRMEKMSEIIIVFLSFVSSFFKSNTPKKGKDTRYIAV